MKKIEIGLVVFALLSVTLEIFNVVGSSFLSMISFLVLSCLYYGFSFALFNGIGFRGMLKAHSYKGVSLMQILMSIAAGLGLANLLVGILFKMLDLEAAGELLVAGVITISFALVVTIWKFVKERSPV